MAKAEPAVAAEEVEWLSWDETLRVLRAAQVGFTPWDVIADWCGQGLVQSRASSITMAGKLRKDEDIDAVMWRLCRSIGGAHLDPFSGAIRWHHQHPVTKEPATMSVLGPQFRKDQVLAIVSGVPTAEIEAALSEKGPWLGAKIPQSRVHREEPAPAATVVEAVAVRPIGAKVRHHPETDRQRAFRGFVNFREENDYLSQLQGAPLLEAYSRWCAKNGKPAYGKSAFYEQLNKVRS